MVSLAPSPKRLYELYYYFLPLSVMSNGEIYVFNALSVILFTLGTYYTVFILPRLLVRAFENLFYYMTGNFISINVIISTILIGRNLRAKAWEANVNSSIAHR